MIATSEQEECIDKFNTRKTLRINAYAGTGKTATLTMLANQTNRKGTYLAFNKSIAEDAAKKFPRTISCSTQHSLAFRSLRGTYAAEKMFGNINGGFIAAKFKLNSYEVNPILEIRPRGVGSIVHSTIRRWCSSGRDEMRPYDVPMDGALEFEPNESKDQLRRFIIPLAKRVWERMVDRSDDFPLGHDGYLKIWAMGRPAISGDFILLDEAQDTSGVMMELMRHQSSQLIAVGDRWQSIYEWRGATNAMTELPTELESRLSMSFRFGDAIAGCATEILQVLGETTPLRGNPSKSDALATCDKPCAVIARTNAFLIENMINSIESGKRPCVVGGVGEMMEMVTAAEKLMANQSVDRPLEFFGFRNWSEVQDHVEREEGVDIRRIVKTIDKWGTAKLRSALEGLPKQESQADVIMSTGHKSKGREFKSVQLCSDFLMKVKTEQEKAKDRECAELEGVQYVEPEPPDAELRLFYVACTRAESILDIPSGLIEKMAGLGANISTGDLRSKQVDLPPEPPKAQRHPVGRAEKRKKRKFSDADLELIENLANEALCRDDDRSAAIDALISKLNPCVVA